MIKQKEKTDLEKLIQLEIILNNTELRRLIYHTTGRPERAKALIKRQLSLIRYGLIKYRPTPTGRTAIGRMLLNMMDMKRDFLLDMYKTELQEA